MNPLPGSLGVAGNVSARLRLLGPAGIKPAPPYLASQPTEASLEKRARQRPIFSEGSW